MSKIKFVEVRERKTVTVWKGGHWVEEELKPRPDGLPQFYSGMPMSGPEFLTGLNGLVEAVAGLQAQVEYNTWLLQRIALHLKITLDDLPSTSDKP